MREYKPAINPICKEVAFNSMAKIGRIGIMSPKPSKSIKIVIKRTKIGDLLFMIHLKSNIRTLCAIVD
jgi:hypothetical protein